MYVNNSSIKYGFAGGYLDNGELWTGLKYIKARTEDVLFIQKNKDAPVQFSKTDHYIRMFVNNKWVTVNGITRRDYYKIVNQHRSRF